MAVANSYFIREARPDEQSALVTFLEEHFFSREYVNKVYLRKNKYRIDETEKKIIAEDIKRKYSIAVTHLPCLVVIHKESQKIVGMNLMLVEGNPRFAETNADKSYIEKWNSVPWQSKVLAELATYVLKPANDSVNVFSKFPLNPTALKLLFLCVDPDHSCRNLATRLVQETVHYAKSRGIGFVYGLFMSAFSQKAAEKNGFQKLSNVELSSFRDHDGNVIFQGENSHVVSVMATQIQFISASS